MQYGNIPVEKQDATVVAHIMMHNGPEKEEKNLIFDHTVLLHWGLFKFKLSRIQLMEMILFQRKFFDKKSLSFALPMETRSETLKTTKGVQN